MPVVAEGSNQIQAAIPVTRLGEPPERRQKVVEFDREAPADEVMAVPELVAETRGERTIVSGMASGEIGDLEVDRQLFQGKSADCLQCAESSRYVGKVD